MVDDIYKRIWNLSPAVMQKANYSELTDLTRDLIALYDDQGRLSEDPFTPTRKRELSLPFDPVQKVLKGSICLVTGGSGCVGSALVRELLKFDVKEIVIMDNKVIPEHELPPRVTFVKCDLRDYDGIVVLFKKYRPNIVFHAAAQRDPGYAETHVFETISTNVLGTFNVVRACEAFDSVKQCVFSSTGKASRYFTQEIYAGTKKMCEFILDAYAKRSRVRYGMVRFTHILDNSLMNQQLLDECENDPYVAVHCPGKFVTAQNVREAACLMLNALIYSENGQCNFLVVRNLEWPVESLEMALYYIKRSNKRMPVIFMGNPVGYTEKFFRGQMDWSNPQDLNLLINVYEQRYRRCNEENDIIISRIASVNEDVVYKATEKISDAVNDKQAQHALIRGLKEIVSDSLSFVNKGDTVNILNWGLQQRFLDIEKCKISDYGPIVPMMFESLEYSHHYKRVESLLYQRA
ncbi:MAG: polysaccharide biosynthesis protein [Chryseolinea sp.]